jgi:O-antigen ligase
MSGVIAVRRRVAILVPFFVLSIILSIILLAAPGASLTRLISAPTETSSGHIEGRQRVYGRLLEHAGSFVLQGVGAGNYEERVGYDYDIVDAQGSPLGAHNCFLQVLLFWGIPGLAAFCWLVWQVYRCIPSGPWNDYVKFALLGIALAELVHITFMHQLYSKDLGLAVGLLVGSQRWIAWDPVGHLSSEWPSIRRMRNHSFLSARPLF